MLSGLNRLSIVAVLATVLGLVSTAGGATWTIRPDGSGDFATVQAAVQASVDGDIIVLTAGTFTGPGNTDILLLGRSLTIRSESGQPGAVTIDCAADSGNPRRGIAIAEGEGRTTTLEGLTIVNGYGHAGASIPSAGALLIAYDTVAIVRNCVFENNHVDMAWDNAGGAVYVDAQSAATFENCDFRANSGFFGGAVAVNHYSAAEFVDCRFLDNSGGLGGAIWGNSTRKTGCLFARNSADEGGAIWGNGYNEELSISCTYAANSAALGGAICAVSGYGEPVTLIDTIIAGCPEGESIRAAADVPVQLSCSDLHGNAGGDWIGNFAAQVDLNGNFSADPCFCAPDSDDFQLCADSCCLPGQHPWGCDQLVGAFGEGCGECSCSGPVSLEAMSWGAVKARYR